MTDKKNQNTSGPPRGPRAVTPPWEKRGGRQRSRSPRRERGGREQRGGSHQNGNRDSQYRERDELHSRNNRGQGKKRGNPASRRGSTSSSDWDRPDFGADREGGRNKKATAGGSTALDYDEQEAIAPPDAWYMDAEDIKAIMGFGEFYSTNDKQVIGNKYIGAVNKTVESEYRQYMNRPGGFNRPLSPSRGNQFAKPANTGGIKKK